VAESSASASSGFSAAQLNRTNGLSARRDARTKASATRSFPVPLSPVISTVTSRGATRLTRSARRDIAAEAKTSECKRLTSPRSCSFSRSSCRVATERRTTVSTSSTSNGLRK